MDTKRLKEALDTCRGARNHTIIDAYVFAPWIALVEELAQLVIDGANGEPVPSTIPTETRRALAEGEVFLPRGHRDGTIEPYGVGAAWSQKDGDKLTPAFRYPDGHVEVIEPAIPYATSDLIDAVRAWANSDCGATEAEHVLKRLAEYDDAQVKAGGA